jgi:hypothetical protein
MDMNNIFENYKKVTIFVALLIGLLLSLMLSELLLKNFMDWETQFFMTQIISMAIDHCQIKPIIVLGDLCSNLIISV